MESFILGLIEVKLISDVSVHTGYFSEVKGMAMVWWITQMEASFKESFRTISVVARAFFEIAMVMNMKDHGTKTKNMVKEFKLLGQFNF